MRGVFISKFNYNMKILVIPIAILLINSVVGSKEVDSKLLRCLVCRATVKEIEAELGKIDPAREVEVGNYRLDAEGNIIHKKVPLVQSEVHISDMLDSICEKMADYVKATYKSNNELTILNLLGPSGAMNPEMTKVDIIQDGDLNKSLKYYCEGIVEEYEDSIISLFTRKENNIKRELCTNVAKICDPSYPSEDDNEDIEEDNTSEDHDEL